MYELERLVEGVPFEVFDQLGDSVWIGPCFAAVVAGPESVGIRGPGSIRAEIYSKDQVLGLLRVRNWSKAA